MGSRSVIVAAMDTIRRAEDALHATVEREFPVGAPIKWVKGRYTQEGTVLMHGWMGRLNVLNRKTNAHVWIQAADVVGSPASGGAEHG